MSHEIKVQAEIEIPTVPNFLIYANLKPGLRQEGFKERPKIDVADVDDDSLRAIGAEWTEALIANAQKRRKSDV